VELGVVHAERARVEQEKAATAEALLLAEREFVETERQSLALIDQKLTQQRLTTAAEIRASKAIAGRLEAEKNVAASARQRADQAQAEADAMQQRALAEQAATQAIADKAAAQQALLETAQAHAAMQRKVADTTVAMMAAKQKLLELETRRYGAAQKVLAVVEAKVVAEEGAVVATLDAARARKEAARQSLPAEAGKAVWRSR
jgi:hypothetical protein